MPLKPTLLTVLLCGMISLSAYAQCEQRLRELQVQLAERNQTIQKLSQENMSLADIRRKLEKQVKRLNRDNGDFKTKNTRLVTENDALNIEVRTLRNTLAGTKIQHQREMDSLRHIYATIDDSARRLTFMNGELERLLRYQHQNVASLHREVDSLYEAIDSIISLSRDYVNLEDQYLYFDGRKVDFGESVVFVRARAEGEKFKLDMNPKKNDLKRFCKLLLKNRYKVRIYVYYCCDREYKTFAEQVRKYMQGIAPDLTPILRIDYENRKDWNMGVYVVIKRVK